MTRLDFEYVIRDASAGNAKVQKGDYQPLGKFPIIDQGQEFIGGFTDDANCLVAGKGPWIVFGDHTRALKFVDFPFCMGADGVKVLKSTDEKAVDLKFVHHFLQSANIPSAGYSRHYKFLKRLQIPLPPLNEQKRIAAILDKADQLRQKRRHAVALLDSLTQSIFLEMFGDPKTDRMKWPTVGFSKACVDETSKSPKVQLGNYFKAGAIPVIDQGQKLIAGYTETQNICVSRGPIVLFGDHTRVVKYVDFDFAIGADGAKVLKPSALYEPVFFAALLSRLPIPDLGYSRHMREVKKLQFPVPDFALQSLFAKKLSELQSWGSLLQSAVRTHETLFASLQHRAFSGQL